MKGGLIYAREKSKRPKKARRQTEEAGVAG